MTALGWDHPDTARAYERFCNRYARYRRANAALVAHADLRPGQAVLDVAAGTGRTAEAALPFIGSSGRIHCVEPAAAMRALGERRLRDSRVTWTDALPTSRHNRPPRFDRILCGAAFWQLSPLSDTVAVLASLLRRDGALCVNIPSLYLGEPDEPGGGRDPLLLQLPALADRSPRAPSRSAWDETAVPSSEFPNNADAVDALLIAAGLAPTRWTFRVRLTQAAYRDWLAIPVVSEGLLSGLAVRERARRLSAAYERSDRSSWRWERWTGWTAWRRSS